MLINSYTLSNKFLFCIKRRFARISNILGRLVIVFITRIIPFIIIRFIIKWSIINRDWLTCHKIPQQNRKLIPNSPSKIVFNTSLTKSFIISHTLRRMKIWKVNQVASKICAFNITYCAYLLNKNTKF